LAAIQPGQLHFNENVWNAQFIIQSRYDSNHQNITLKLKQGVSVPSYIFTCLSETISHLLSQKITIKLFNALSEH